LRRTGGERSRSQRLSRGGTDRLEATTTGGAGRGSQGRLQTTGPIYIYIYTI
jgi:hypothetical protein